MSRPKISTSTTPCLQYKSHDLRLLHGQRQREACKKPPSRQPAGPERPAPTMATGVHGAPVPGKPRRLQDLLPLPAPTHRTQEKTQQAPPRRTNVMLRSLFDPLLSAADDVVEVYRCPETPPDSGYDVQTSPKGWQGQHPQTLFATQRRNNPQAILSPAQFQPIPCLRLLLIWYR